MTGNEQAAIVIFFAGFFLNLAIIAGSLKRIGLLVVIFSLSLLLIWFYSEPGESAFDIFGASMVLFFVATAFVMYDRVLPTLYSGALVIYSILFFYVLWNLFDGTRAPNWFWVIPAVPAVLALGVYISASKSIPGFLKQLFYFWFLVTGVSFAAAQFQVDSLKAIYDEQGWSWLVYAHVFLAGMVSVNLLAYVIFIILHLPFGPRRSVVEQALTGDSEDVAGEIKKHMREQFVLEGPGLFTVVFIALVAGGAVYNTITESVPHVLFLDLCLVLIAPLYGLLARPSREAAHE